MSKSQRSCKKLKLFLQEAVFIPRSFDSDSEPAGFAFTENVTCPGCDEVFEGQFFDYSQSLSFQDIADPPLGTHTCPACGRRWRSEMTGWMFYGEAG